MNASDHVSGIPVPIQRDHEVWQSFITQVIDRQSSRNFITWCRARSVDIMRRARMRHAYHEHRFRQAKPRPVEMMTMAERLVIKEMQDYSKALETIASICEAMAMRISFRHRSSMQAVLGRPEWVSTVCILIAPYTLLYTQTTINAQLSDAPPSLPTNMSDRYGYCGMVLDNGIAMTPTPFGGVVSGEWLVLCEMHGAGDAV